MDGNLASLVESGRPGLVTGAVNALLMQGRAEMDHAATVGSGLFPQGDGQYILMSAAYLAHAQKAGDPNRKLWQYAVAIAAARKAESPDCEATCWQHLEADFPDLPEAVRDYLQDDLIQSAARSP